MDIKCVDGDFFLCDLNLCCLFKLSDQLHFGKIQTPGGNLHNNKNQTN